MARDDPKAPRQDIRNDRRPIPQKHHSARGEAPRNSGNFTRGSQLLNTQVLMWLQGAKMPIYMWLGIFVIAYSTILSLTLDENNIQLITMRILAHPVCAVGLDLVRRNEAHQPASARRQRAPHLHGLRALCGTNETIPADILTLLLTQARSGCGRLMVVDEGSQLARLHPAQDADFLLDPAIGNWDLFADHLTQHELACAGEAILRSDGVAPEIYNAVSCVLAEMLWEVAAQPGARLRDVSERVRAFGYESMANAMRLDLDTASDTRAGWTALARLQEDAGRFAAGTNPTPTSIRRWLTTSPRSVLFLTAEPG
jgi:hypothetical protein